MDIPLNGISGIYNQIFADYHPKYDDNLQALNLNFVFMYIIPDDDIVEHDIPQISDTNDENLRNPNRN